MPLLIVIPKDDWEPTHDLDIPSEYEIYSSETNEHFNDEELTIAAQSFNQKELENPKGYWAILK